MEAFNQSIFEIFYSLAHRSVLLNGLFIFLAKYLPWLVVLFALTKVLRKKDWKNNLSRWKNRFQYFSLGLIAVVLSRGIVANIIETVISSPRPFAALEIEPIFNHVAASSMPSGHMAALIPVALTLFLISRAAGWWALLLTLVVGAARIVAGIHWPSDILVGILIGALSFFLVRSLFRRRKLI